MQALSVVLSGVGAGIIIIFSAKKKIKINK